VTSLFTAFLVAVLPLELLGVLMSGASSLVFLPMPAALPVLDDDCVTAMPTMLWRMDALPLSDLCLDRVCGA
jgi:hypothetical protein